MSADARALVVVDTNVLLAATDTSRASHPAALDFLNLDERRLALTPQIVREYLAVSTRPLDVNGLGLSGAAAVANLGELLGDMVMLSEDGSTSRALFDLIVADSAAGKQVHDANVVAVALTHGAVAIVTDNVRHFSRFQHLIEVEGLLSATA